jgi:hypothetical protein
MAAYASVTEVKTYKGIAGSSDDSLLSDILDRVSNWLDRECLRVLYTASDSTRYYHSWDAHGRTLCLDHDLCAITSVTLDGTALASTEYVVEPRNDTPWHSLQMKVHSAYNWQDYSDDPEDNIAIVGKWAYYAAIPNDLKQMVIRLALYAYTLKDANVFDTIAIPDAGVIQVPSGFPADVGRWVRLHRRL